MSTVDQLDLIDAMILVIRHESTSSAVARLAANVIAADADFNARISLRKKDGLSEEVAFRFLDFSDQTLADAQSIAHAIKHGEHIAEAGNRLGDLYRRIYDHVF